MAQLVWRPPAGVDRITIAQIEEEGGDRFLDELGWATALLVIALIGSLALPRRKPELAHGASPAAAAI